MHRYLPLLFVLFLLPACTSDKGFLISGESLNALGQTFVVTGQAMNQMLDAKQVTPEQYKAWATFALNFQSVYPSCVQTWKDAVLANDLAREQRVTQAIIVLAGSLGQWVAVVSAMNK